MTPTLLALVLTTAASPLEPAELEGTWALEMVARSAARVPVLGEVETTTRTGVLVHLEPDGEGGWLHHHQACGSELEGGGPVQTRIPAAYYEAVPAKLLVPTVSASPQGLRYEVDLERFVGGWDPSRCDAVPSVPDDPCVTDWDGDREPGITLKVKAPLFSWVDVYVAQQTHPWLSGVVTSPDRIEGGLRVTEVDNQVLGSSNRLFAANPETRMLSEGSGFTMTRIPDDATCEVVLATTEISSPW